MNRITKQTFKEFYDDYGDDFPDVYSAVEYYKDILYAAVEGQISISKAVLQSLDKYAYPYHIAIGLSTNALACYFSHLYVLEFPATFSEERFVNNTYYNNWIRSRKKSIMKAIAIGNYPNPELKECMINKLKTAHDWLYHNPGNYGNIVVERLGKMPYALDDYVRKIKVTSNSLSILVNKYGKVSYAGKRENRYFNYRAFEQFYQLYLDIMPF